MYQGSCLVPTRAQPALCNQQQNTTFISTIFIISHACSRGDNRGDTLQLHKARTEARALSMPRAKPVLYNQQQNTTFISSYVCNRGDDTRDTDTLALAQGMYQGRVPRPCPRTTGDHVINNKTPHLLVVTDVVESTSLGVLLLLHKARTIVCVPRPCPCTAGIM